MHALQIATNTGWQSARDGAGGQHQIVIGDHLVPQGNRLGRCIDRIHSCIHTQVNLIVAVKRFRTQKQSLQRHLAQQIGLAKWGALIRRHWFRPNQSNLALKPAIAQLGHTRRPGLPSADNNNMRHNDPLRIDWPTACHKPIWRSATNTIT